MPIRKLLLILIFLSYDAIALAAAEKKQPDENAPSRAVNKKGVGASLGGPGLAYSVNLDYYITPNFDIEIGGSYLPPSGQLSLVASYLGVKYAIWGNDPGQRWSPYIGAMATVMVLSVDAVFANGSSGLTSGSLFSQTYPTERVSVPFFGVYIPLGIELIAFNGFTFAFELAYYYYPNQSRTVQSSSTPGATTTIELISISNGWAGLKLGYHF